MPTREKRLRLERNRRLREQAALAAPSPEVSPLSPPQEDLVMAATTTPTHWVRFTLPGVHSFTYHGVAYDRGQVLDLAGTARDEQLERLGFVQKVEPGQVRLHTQCGVCGAVFISEVFRDAHGRERHSDRFRAADLDVAPGMHGPEGGAAVRDTTGDADERRMQAEYPLYLDKTRATLTG